MQVRRISQNDLPNYTEEQWLYITGNRCSSILELTEDRNSDWFPKGGLFCASGVDRVVFICTADGKLLSTLFIEKQSMTYTDKERRNDNMLRLVHTRDRYGVFLVISKEPKDGYYYNTYVTNYSMLLPRRELLKKEIPDFVAYQNVNPRILGKLPVRMYPLADSLKVVRDLGKSAHAGSIDLSTLLTTAIPVFRDTTSLKVPDLKPEDFGITGELGKNIVVGEWCFECEHFGNVPAAVGLHGAYYAYYEVIEGYVFIVFNGTSVIVSKVTHIDKCKKDCIADMVDEDDVADICISIYHNEVPRCVRVDCVVQFSVLCKYHKMYAKYFKK